jgi:hypothetical protein
MHSVSSGAEGQDPTTNPNLLLWTEELDNAIWQTDSAITPDNAIDPLSGSTADTISFLADGFVSQVSSTAATTGVSGNNGVILTTSWVRYEVTSTFDGLSYVFSVYLRGASGGEEVRLNLSRAGGFLKCFLIENASAPATVRAWGAQLEQAGTASTYQHRTT